MDNNNIVHDTVMSQCLQLLKLEDLPSGIYQDYYTKKLTTSAAVQLFIESQLNKRESYDDIVDHLQSDSSFQEMIGLKSISTSQLSRKIRSISTSFLHGLFQSVTERIKEKTENDCGIPSPREKYQRKSKYNIGKLSIVDSSQLSLSYDIAKWARISQTSAGVKIHTRFVVASPDIGFVDKVVLSTADISDNDPQVLMELVVGSDTTYVFDRGYISFKLFSEWIDKGSNFVARIKENNRTEILEDFPLPEKHPKILRDALVKLGNMKESLRLVEFMDDKGRKYRVVTTRMDLQSYEIAEIYRNRWLIELFFKWVKQHLRVVRLLSNKPDGIWNQILFALIAYGLCLLIKLETGTKKTIWEILVRIRNRKDKSWAEFLKVLFPSPTRTSKGRKKKGGRKSKAPDEKKSRKKIKGPQIIKILD